MVPRSLRGWRLTMTCLAAAAIHAQEPLLTVDHIYGAGGWSRFNGSRWASMSWAANTDPWIDDRHYLWPSEDADVLWQKVDAISGTRETLVSRSELAETLIRAGAGAEAARIASADRAAPFTARRDAMLVEAGGDLYVYGLAEKRAVRVTRSPGVRSETSFSPDGQRLAFVAGNNLHVASSAAAGERTLTRDGTDVILNGRLDWVYSEELYGRGNHRGYWWSPKSTQIAFLQLDERNVPQFTLVDDIPYRPAVQRWPYPKAGDRNPTARLGVVDVASGRIRWIDTSQYDEHLIVSVAWAPDGRRVAFQVQDRTQTFLDLNVFDTQTGETRRVLRETSPAWVERWQDPSVDPLWLPDGGFVWLSERSGWRHAYRYSASGELVGTITSGEWEIRKTHGVDEPAEWFYFSATADGPRSLGLYRVRLDGTGRERLTRSGGTHRVFLNASRTLFLDSKSDAVTPPRVDVFRTGESRQVSTADANPVPALAEAGFAAPEFHQVKARDGFVMEAMLIKPQGFDPSKRHPVYQFVYGGPHIQTVVDAWGGSDYVYHQSLAQRGIVVWICDNRTASGNGMQSAWGAHKRLGALELRDLEDCLDWLTAQPWVDAARVGISGISYGGYLTLYAMTHSRRFAMGIAEGAVSDWRSYDTVYTERYLGLPGDNPDGYRQSSPRFSAANLTGELLLIHGSLDDNVHPQHAMQFAYELQRAGRPFRLMVYPKSAHGISDVQLAPHMRRLMLDFTVQNLLR